MIQINGLIFRFPEVHEDAEMAIEFPPDPARSR
jgi:hypothetical protein